MLKLNVNGSERSFDGDPSMPLLWFLRDEAGLTGTKFGCGMAQCGACTIHLDGQPVRACVMPVAAAAGKSVTTIEGIGADPVGKAVQDDAKNAHYVMKSPIGACARRALGALLLLWFHTVWQAYVIEATQARLSGLREIWREIVARDPAWRHLPEVRSVDRLLEASSANMPKLSVLSLLIRSLTASRAQGAAIAKISFAFG